MFATFIIVPAHHINENNNGQHGVTGGAADRFAKAFNTIEVVHLTVEGHKSFARPDDIN